MGRPTNPRSQDHANRDLPPPEGQCAAPEPTATIGEAIQTGCGSLLALQASLASVEYIQGEHGRAEASLKAAIELVRLAISDLRDSIPDGEPRPLTLGFVSGRRAADEPA